MLVYSIRETSKKPTKKEKKLVYLNITINKQNKIKLDVNMED